MRQRLVLREFGYIESFDRIDFDSYPEPPDCTSPDIALRNYKKRLEKMLLEEPRTLAFIDDLEEGSPRLAILSDELRIAGFLTMDLPMTEFFDIETSRIYKWNMKNFAVMKTWRDIQVGEMFPSGLVYN